MTNKTKKQSPKSYMVYHENPEVFHVGTIESHSYFIPFAKGENPFESREKSSRFELLNGEWGFSHYTSIIDLEEDFIDVKPRGKISVPSNWQLQGYSSENDRIQYTNVSYPIPYNPPFAPDDIPVGVYTRSYFSTALLYSFCLPIIAEYFEVFENKKKLTIWLVFSFNI